MMEMSHFEFHLEKFTKFKPSSKIENCNYLFLNYLLSETRTTYLLNKYFSNIYIFIYSKTSGNALL
jgi:hypothetical protein